MKTMSQRFKIFSKAFLVLLLVAIMAFVIFPATFFADDDAPSATYTVTDEAGLVEVVKLSAGEQKYFEIVIDGMIELTSTLVIPESANVLIVGKPQSGVGPEVEIGLRAASTFTDTALIRAGAGAKLALGVVSDEFYDYSLVLDGDFLVKGTMLVCETGSTVTLNGGMITNNRAASEAEREASAGLYGGGIVVNSGSTFTMNGGSVTECVAGHGAGLAVREGANVIINMGILDRNIAIEGGGIYVEENGTLHIKNVGIVDNVAKGYKVGAQFLGRAMGAGMYIDSSSVNIEAGTIAYNRCERYAEDTAGSTNRISHGGGIYLNNGRSMQMDNVLVMNNTANREGGGLWHCPYGTGAINFIAATSVYNNTAGVEGDDFFSTQKDASSAGNTLFLSSYALDGSKTTWYADPAASRYNASTSKPVEVGELSTLESLQFKNIASDETKLKSESLAKIFIMNNTADFGGGIANNGILTSGVSIDTNISIEAVKIWNDNNNGSGIRPASVNVTLFKDGVTTGQTAVLNEQNAWKHTFTGLKADGAYTIVEDAVAGYLPSYGAATVSADQKVVTIEITNTLSTPIKFSKTAVNSTVELPGATLQVFKIVNDVEILIEEWVSTKDQKEIVLEYGQQYRMTETIAPKGYKIASSIDFRVTMEGKIELLVGGNWVAQKGSTVAMVDEMINPPITPPQPPVPSTPSGSTSSGSSSGGTSSGGSSAPVSLSPGSSSSSTTVPSTPSAAPPASAASASSGGPPKTGDTIPTIIFILAALAIGSLVFVLLLIFRRRKGTSGED